LGRAERTHPHVKTAGEIGAAIRGKGGEVCARSEETGSALWKKIKKATRNINGVRIVKVEGATKGGLQKGRRSFG